MIDAANTDADTAVTTSTALPSPIETDALIIGAGPAGLFQVFELGLLEIQAHVIDTLPHAGGQCVELYGDKPIYDIPGLPVVTGEALTQNLLQQIQPFGATFHFGQQVSQVQPQDDGRFFVATQQGLTFLTKTVFIAGGVGAFMPRTLRTPGVEQHEGRQVHYRVADPSDFAGQDLLILGEDVSVDWALRFCAAHADGHAHKARSVTLLHRRDAFSADPQAVAQMRALNQSQGLQLAIGQIMALEESHDGRLQGVSIIDADGTTRQLPCTQVLALLGLSPKLGPIAEWGLAMEKKHLVVDTATFETSTPGIYAIGDINTYPGKKKLILCGFHEATLAAFAAAARIHPDRRIQLQYTTSSPRLQQLLGVAPAAAVSSTPS